MVICRILKMVIRYNLLSCLLLGFFLGVFKDNNYLHSNMYPKYLCAVVGHFDNLFCVLCELVHRLIDVARPSRAHGQGPMRAPKPMVGGGGSHFNLDPLSGVTKSLLGGPDLYLVGWARGRHRNEGCTIKIQMVMTPQAPPPP